MQKQKGGVQEEITEPDRRAGLKPATDPFIGTNAAGVKAEAVARAATQRMATFIIFCKLKLGHLSISMKHKTPRQIKQTNEKNLESGHE